ncbi:GxxExxY protein [bacterium (Candidatus Gribaldobacteria) CG07_land_8_20_14_0_80_33_18]|uniref:GxxExxY protein n=1 Tax=bacterium (Candidatus Gribaldobacteria) CG07_land_8_20_14_0_80_33_18 TaxID=2014272 RepID=A0A2M6Z435_9BACT|nr:MAG: GxxExxY protein [bacterium (Candidatus Gribaldobacteria) CG10_big_fil_rev_8_21_14_0_10_33_41]PIU47095.1 MAG: GxxExxY protein [bacterium (Candidatus Gribaldobacteria) CG07_land_8_20_14_0_80_33_18]PJA01039.1 MAG: GxxExxY protein [bacterium (Candidatus Gribaldobacteria) CG_4_10_14_0_2_um_filter_33_15]PJB08961.1 MAG: GxxExxY protein [bacterium (Candidatus Gribaldobacteria) CG_4_9_14_3_um_filter_33_9]
MKKLPKRKDLIYPELSYTLIGVLFDVYNHLGPGHKEKYYQKAVAIALKDINLLFKEQLYSPVIFNDNNIGRYYLDFLIEDKIVLEIKSGEKFLKQNITQIYSYLKIKKLKLGILANFTKEGLKFRRILNIR